MDYTFQRGDGATVLAPAGVEPPVLNPAAAPPADLQRDKAGRLLVQLFVYLENNAEQHPALLSVAPVLTSAIAGYRSGQPADPFDGVRKVLQAIHAVRATDPSIPDT